MKTKYVFLKLQLVKLWNYNATKRQLQKRLPGKMYTAVGNKQNTYTRQLQKRLLGKMYATLETNKQERNTYNGKMAAFSLHKMVVGECHYTILTITKVGALWKLCYHKNWCIQKGHHGRSSLILCGFYQQRSSPATSRLFIVDCICVENACKWSKSPISYKECPYIMLSNFGLVEYITHIHTCT